MNAQQLHPVFAGLLQTFAGQPAQLRRAAYVSALRRHDWGHEYSDDINAWRRGREELAQLRAEQREIDPDFELWNRNCPEECKNGGRA